MREKPAKKTGRVAADGKSTRAPVAVAPVPSTEVKRRTGVAGFKPFPAQPGKVTTNAQVDALRDAEGA